MIIFYFIFLSWLKMIDSGRRIITENLSLMPIMGSGFRDRKVKKFQELHFYLFYMWVQPQNCSDVMKSDRKCNKEHFCCDLG